MVNLWSLCIVDRRSLITVVLIVVVMPVHHIGKQRSFPLSPKKGNQCRVEELALPTRAIQLSGEVLSTHEAASAELCEAEAAHRTCSSRCLFKAMPTTPWVCRELHSLRQVCVINI